jgi:hypothetical protein
MRNEKSPVEAAIHFKPRILREELLDRLQWAGPSGGKHWKGVNHAILNQDQASRRDEWGVGAKLGQHMRARMVAVQNDHDGSIGIPGTLANNGENLGVDGTSDQELDALMFQRMHSFHINADDSAVVEKVEKVGVEQCGAPAIGSRLKEHGGPDLGNRLLQ